MMSLWFERAWINNGWEKGVRLHVADGRIASVEAGVAAEREDECHRVGLPGLCNVHSHGFQRGMAGLSERRSRPDDNFWSWREIMYRFLDRLTPDDVAAITAQAYAEMLETGFTRVGEFHYLHRDPVGATYADPAEMAGAIVRASGETGIGLTLLPVFYAHGNFDAAPPSPGTAAFPRTTSTVSRRCSMHRGRNCSSDANIGDRAALASRGDARRARSIARNVADWPGAYPRRRTGEGGRRLRRVERRAAGRMAAGQCRPR